MSAYSILWQCCCSLCLSNTLRVSACNISLRMLGVFWSLNLGSIEHIIPGAPKSIHLKKFINFSRTIESYDIIFYARVTHSIIRNVSLHYNWQNYVAFSHGKLTVETLSKIVSTIQESANAVSASHSLVCAVAQHCYNGYVSFLWEKLKLWPL